MGDCYLNNKNKTEGYVAADEWMPFVLELLKEGKKLKIAPNGYSMYPFLISDRDEVLLRLPDRALKKGDIVLYRRDNGVFVLHRIHHINEKGYYMLGDSQTWIEGPLRAEQILALAENIERKGKTISCNNKYYNLIWRIWMLFRPLRPMLMKVWLLVRKIVDRKEIAEKQKTKGKRAFLEKTKQNGEE